MKNFTTKGTTANQRINSTQNPRPWEESPEMHLQLFDEAYVFFLRPDQQLSWPVEGPYAWRYLVKTFVATKFRAKEVYCTTLRVAGVEG
jgi:transposase